MNAPYDFFLSFAVSEQTFAYKLADTLREHDFNVFDGSEIQPGENWSEALLRGLEHSKVLVPVLGSSTANVMFEIGVAIAKAIDVVPVVTNPRFRHEIPVNLRDLKYVEAHTPEEAAQQLLRMLEAKARHQVS